MSLLTHTRLASCIGALALTAAPAAHAQDEPGVRLSGLEFVAGIVSPENADTGVAIGGRLAIGSLSRSLRLGAGITHWSVDLDEQADGTKGSVSDLAFDVDARLMPARVKMLRPYVLAALAIHSVSADISADPRYEDALSGTNTGVDLGIGAESARAGLGWRAELRRRFVNDVQSWLVLAGVRYTFGADR